MDFDILITGGDLVDGTGAPRRRADVGVKDGRIVKIAKPGTIEGTATETIDATGRVVTPGFIDIHTHLDAQVFWDPWLTPICFSGVTTVIGGNCGFTVTPIFSEADGDYVMKMLSRVEGIPLEPLRDNVPWSWTDTKEYLEAVERTEPAINMGFMAGHSTIRRAVLGVESNVRKATAEEIEEMKKLLGDALAQGALGFTTSQGVMHTDANGDPVPSRVADDEELIALSEVCGDHPGTQISLIPCAYSDFDDHHKVLMAEMSRRANRPLNWNLLVVDEKTDERVAMSDYAAEHDAMVLPILYPGLIAIHYTFLSGSWDGVPNWAEVMTLPPAEKIEALKDPEVRAKLQAGLDSEAGQRRPIAWIAGHVFERGRSPETQALEGLTLKEAAEQRGVSMLDLLLDMQILDDLKLGMRRPAIGADDPALVKKRQELWDDPRVVMGGSDSGAHLDFLPGFDFAVEFFESARAQGKTSVETVVHRISDFPARLYGITDRGRVEEGWYADLLVLDPDTIGPGPMDYKFDLPGGSQRLFSKAVGIDHVIVNGVEIVRDGEVIEGNRPGRIIRSGVDTETVTVH